MKGLSKLVLLGGLLAASAAPALADTVSDNTVSVSGVNTVTMGTNTDSLAFSQSGAYYQGTFQGQAVSGTPTYNTAPLTFASSGMTNFVNAQGTGQYLFFTFGSTSFYIATVTPTTDANGLTLNGRGYYLLSNGTKVFATYTLTTQANGTTTFSAITMASAPTPEPSSLLLLGTGLVSAAGVVIRRRKQAAVVA